MKLNAHNFKENAAKALKDEDLQASLAKLGTGFPLKRLAAAARLPEFEDLRDQARDIKDHTLRHLDFYLERFEGKVKETGGQVHWARDIEDGREIVYDICESVGAKTVTKGKSMIGEEMAINEYLEEKGLIPVETDLGEYIIQLRNEPPSHIIAPAIHLRKSHVEEAFRKTHTDLPPERNLDEPEDLLKEARAMLRKKFIAADVGITGANFMIAETGSTVIVTNEGNGDLTQTLPRVHIVLCSIEKVVPNLDDCATLLRVLARSATGQEQSVYTTFSTGPKQMDDPDGPDQFHVVILDNGRSRMLGHETHDMLRCIRCSACINHCPVYQSVGGHAYGSIYPGPMGSVLTPAIHGLEQSCDLPNASTMCGKCEEVCPVRIPIPQMLRSWREKQWEDGPVPIVQRLAMSVWAFWAMRPKAYHFGAKLKMRLLGMLGRKNGHFKSLLFSKAWTKTRDFPAPEGKTFQQLWSEKGGTSLMSSRDYILGRVRWSLGRGAFERDSCEQLEARLNTPKSNLIPKRGQGDAKEQLSLFVKMATEVNATVSRLKALENVPKAVAKYLKEQELDLKVRLADHTELQKLDWSKLDVSTGPSDGEDLVGVVMAYAGAAETGSLALRSGAESPTTLNFLPDYHIVVLKAADLVGDYEAVYARLRRESNKPDFMPRALNWVTGPSRTADIEQTLLLGAHGPRKLHILVIEDNGQVT